MMSITQANHSSDEMNDGNGRAITREEYAELPGHIQAAIGGFWSPADADRERGRIIDVIEAKLASSDAELLLVEAVLKAEILSSADPCAIFPLREFELEGRRYRLSGTVSPAAGDVWFSYSLIAGDGNWSSEKIISQARADWIVRQIIMPSL